MQTMHQLKSGKSKVSKKILTSSRSSLEAVQTKTHLRRNLLFSQGSGNRRTKGLAIYGHQPEIQAYLQVGGEECKGGHDKREKDVGFPQGLQAGDHADLGQAE